MGQEGDVVNARKVNLSGTNKNLEHLLKNRFSRMNDFVSRVDNGVDLEQESVQVAIS